MNYQVTVLGAGLAGCEAALWLAGKGVQVDLYEQKPVHFSPAHKSAGFAELICSNSLKAERLDTASGLLKEEMRRMGSQLLTAAETARVAAGGALAVDRDGFQRRSDPHGGKLPPQYQRPPGGGGAIDPDEWTVGRYSGPLTDDALGGCRGLDSVRTSSAFTMLWPPSSPPSSGLGPGLCRLPL